ncbi:hypothetical protein AJ80_02415 [Polytolypa hystricis UAMH7299]|uniref:Uncharacterized protein n=1 Tax=Polytolypa hystricis (strain UAMH7299) TaxID=1447883 RepID=A0A2B7YRH5_POLH7|nr:hypothetical protein AJ80_02415 [Polytolypa hystricis UAMH7299]
MPYFKWHLQDDVPYPWGDERGASTQTRWITDLDNDTFIFDKEDRALKTSLHLLRQRRVEESDFGPYDRAQQHLPVATRDAFPPPYNIMVSDRDRAFVSRILSDFPHLWRHILRSPYNVNTFRRLASAIVRLATLDFRPSSSDEKPSLWRRFSVHDVPDWDPFDADIVSIGEACVVLAHDLGTAISLIRKHSASEDKAQVSGSKELHPRNYLVLSVKHIVFCRITGDSLEYAEPEPLLNGIDPLQMRLLISSFLRGHYHITQRNFIVSQWSCRL